MAPDRVTSVSRASWGPGRGLDSPSGGGLRAHPAHASLEPEAERPDHTQRARGLTLGRGSSQDKGRVQFCAKNTQQPRLRGPFPGFQICFIWSSWRQLPGDQRAHSSAVGNTCARVHTPGLGSFADRGLLPWPQDVPGTLPDLQSAGSSRVLGSRKPGTGTRLAQQQGPEDSEVPVQSWAPNC